MASPTGPIVFLSHSHSDRPIARRVFRTLSAHGVRVWLDEQDLRFGSALTSTLRSQIEAADVVLVVASKSSATSKWVGLELEFAEQHDLPIVPIFIDPLTEHERFRDRLGVDAISPQAYAAAVHGIIRDLFRQFEIEPPAADPALLTAGLRQLAAEQPSLAPLISGCLDSQGLHQENMAGVLGVTFHQFDEALNALFELMPKESIASHAAHGFASAGAGVQALYSWIAATGDGGLPLVSALGSTLEPALIPSAIGLIRACNPPNNHALYSFIRKNAKHLEGEQRRAVSGLVTWPLRDTTADLADVLGWVAMKHFPDVLEIRWMWGRWIQSGSFDGHPSKPSDLARYMADAHKEQRPGWEPMHEALRGHVRSCLRSRDKQKVSLALDHIRAAADQDAPVLAALLRETHGVSGSAEWNDWKERDPQTVEWMSWYVFHVAREAEGDRNWLRALNEAKEMVEFEQQVRQASS